MNSKSIGNDYEREFIKSFSKWVTGDDNILIAWRNVHSGSISTIRQKSGKDGSNSSGDFQCLEPSYQYIFDKLHIDSKCYKDVNLLFINDKNIKSNKIFNQWIKTCKEALQVNKFPIMPCKIRDRVTPEFVLLDLYFYTLNVNKVVYQFTDGNEWYSCILVLKDDLFNIDFNDFSKDFLL